ncbi:MAG TPA: ATP synthase F1 subunit gamma [Thermoguttaceae bacterium]|nr:ATP synthase F1 subunit gamma [Thermoguttaceae bacterium]
MARARTLEKRRKAIQNIEKITRTMELIATARFKKAWDRTQATTEYTLGLFHLVRDLAKLEPAASHPLWTPRDQTHRVLLLVLSSNRGLCGGYNAAVVRQTIQTLDRLRAEGCEVLVEVSGKRGASALRFRNTAIQTVHTHLADHPRWEQVEVLAQRYMDELTAGRWDRLAVVYTSSETVGRQRLKTEVLLPLPRPEPIPGHFIPPNAAEYDLYPSGAAILDDLLPRFFKVQLFQCFLQAALSEQIARMFAMKSASENTTKMLHRLSLAHHRARQTQITSEMLEVLSGAEALQQQR